MNPEVGRTADDFNILQDLGGLESRRKSSRSFLFLFARETLCKFNFTSDMELDKDQLVLPFRDLVSNKTRQRYSPRAQTGKMFLYWE